MVEKDPATNRAAPRTQMPRATTYEGRMTFYDEVQTRLQQYGIEEADVLLRGLDAAVPNQQRGAFALTLSESRDKARHFRASPYDYTTDALEPAIAVYDASAFGPPSEKLPNYHPLLPEKSLEDALLLLIELQ
jgi:hypothetical protein